MQTTDLYAAPPAPDRTWTMLRRIGRVLNRPVCWTWRRGYYFRLDDGRTIALTPESAGRYRIDLCHFLDPRVTLWALASDEERVLGVVLDLAQGEIVRQEV